MSQTYFVLQLLGGIAFLIGTTAFLYAMSQDRRGGKLHRISAAIAAGGLPYLLSARRGRKAAGSQGRRHALPPRRALRADLRIGCPGVQGRTGG